MSSTESIEKLATYRFLCEESTLNFTRYFFKQRFHRRFVVGDHHVQICKALDAVVRGEIKKLIINIAPRYGKTELAVKNFMAYGLSVNPAARFIHLSYSDDLALDNSEEVKDIVKSPGFQQFFPKVKVKPNSDSKKKWYTTAGGGVYATSTAGQVTGFGAGQVDDPEEIDHAFLTLAQSGTKFAGALIIDDPIKPEDADSEVVRTRINARWDSTIKNRVNSRNTPIIIIMQRLHEDDLCGYLLSQSDDWTVLSLPSIKADGTALWPFKHTIEELRKIESENPVVFERQHMQTPKPLAGVLFPRSGDQALKRFRLSELRKEEAAAVIAYGDPADEGTDHFSMPAAYLFPNKIFVTGCVFTQDNLSIAMPRIEGFVASHDRYKPLPPIKPGGEPRREIIQQIDYIRIEALGAGSAVHKEMVRLIRDGASRVLAVKDTREKHARILSMELFVKRHCLFLADEDIEPGSDYDKFFRQLTAYMKDGSVKKDDAPDSLTGLVKMAMAFYSHLFT